MPRSENKSLTSHTMSFTSAHEQPASCRLPQAELNFSPNNSCKYCTAWHRFPNYLLHPSRCRQGPRCVSLRETWELVSRADICDQPPSLAPCGPSAGAEDICCPPAQSWGGERSATPQRGPSTGKGPVSCFEPLIAERDEVMIRAQREGKAMGDQAVSELPRCVRWCKQMCRGCCRARPPPSHSHQASPRLHRLSKAARAHSQQIFTAHISNIKLIQLN